MRFLSLVLLAASLAAAEPVPCTFSCSFDGTADPQYAAGAGMAMPQTEQYVPGHTGQALAIDSPDGAVYYLAGGNLPKDRGAIEFWLQPRWEPGDQGRQGFVCGDMGNAKAGTNTIWIWKIGGSLRFDVRDPADSYITAGLADWRKGEWHHVVANWDSEAGISLYVDGKLIREQECTWVPRKGLRFIVGKRQQSAEAAEAALDELFVYRRPLTAEEAALAHDGKLVRVPAPREAAPVARVARKAPELLFHLPFDGSCAAKAKGGDGQPIRQEKVTFQPGVHGGAAVFLPESRLSFANAGNLNKEAGTISFWYKPFWKPGGGEVWRCCFKEGPQPKDRGGSNMMWLWFWGDRLRFDVSDPRDSYTAYSVANWNPERWHHVAVTWDCAKGKRTFLDGVEVGVASDGKSAVMPTAWSVFDTFTEFSVGCAGSGRGADGLMDDFRIYDGPLDVAAIQADFARVFPLAVEFAKPGPPYLTIGQRATLEWQVRLVGDKPFRCPLRWRLLGPDGAVLGDWQTEALAVAGKGDKQAFRASVTPVQGGTHTIEVACPSLGAGWRERLLFETVSPEPTAPRPTELATDLLERIEFTAQLPQDRYAEVGTTALRESGAGRYREASGARNDRFAIHVTVPEADAAYVVEVDYPDDKPRTMEILAQPANSSGGAYELQTGMYCGDEYPLTGRMLTHRCVFWARDKEMAFLFMTAEEGRPAAVSEMRLYRLTARLPNRLGSVGAFPRRHVGVYYEDPALCYDFGGHDAMPGFAKTIDRLMDYMEWSGQDLFMYPGVWYHGPLYPSRSQQLAMSRNHPGNFIGYVLARFEARGLGFIPTWNVHSLSTLTGYKCDEATLLSGNLPKSPLMVYKDGMPNLGGWHGTPPNYNPLHPEVRQAILTMVDEMLELYGDSPAFRGICFHLPRHVMLWFGHADAGYNDYCVEAFEKETGIRIPVAADDASRARKRWSWLKDNAWEPWIAWRCRAIHGLYAEVASHLTAKRPDLKLIINSYRPTVTDCRTDADFMSPGYVLRVNRESGLDPSLFVGDPNIVIQQTIYPADYRWSRAHRKSEQMERQRQRHFEAQTFATLQGLPNAWVNMHDRYWEDAIGRKAPIQADWLKETGWRVSTLNPTPPQFLQHYLAPLRFGDVQTITKGGFLIGTHGVEDQLVEFSRAFRALPPVRFADAGKQGDVVVRQATHDGKLYFYVANTGRSAAAVKLVVEGQAGAVLDLVDGKRTAGALVAVELPAYTLRSYCAEGQAARVALR